MSPATPRRVVNCPLLQGRARSLTSWQRELQRVDARGTFCSREPPSQISRQVHSEEMRLAIGLHFSCTMTTVSAHTHHSTREMPVFGLKYEWLETSDVALPIGFHLHAVYFSLQSPFNTSLTRRSLRPTRFIYLQLWLRTQSVFSIREARST